MSAAKETQPDTSHVVMAGQAMECLHCGARQPVAMPCDVDVLLAMINAYLAKHGPCVKAAS